MAKIEYAEKYHAVIGGYHFDEDGKVDSIDEWEDAAEGYMDALDVDYSTLEVYDDQGNPIEVTADDLGPITWDHVSVPRDPDLLERMATYFDGIYPDEHPGRIRAKLRLVDVEDVINVQIAARAELRRTDE